ncbi:AMP-binding protein [Streptomyces sp. NPDC126510]|uniref:AMP-binding protein n=1 Tax=Streptomyces sp. NPDC126510 TaxID=3155317 RepID=UPI003317C0A5
MAVTGEVVALVGEGGTAWADAYRGVLETGGVPLLVDPAAPAAEHARWLDRAGGGRFLDTRDGVLSAAPAASGGPPSAYRPGTVLLPSSGTTGTPKLVVRSVDSLRAEGRRHAIWAGLTDADRVLLPLPPWHAYALGWLHAALEAGAALRIHPPTALGAVVRDIEEGATVLPVVPAVARLLSARVRRAPRTGSALRLAMVGAGAVDEALDEAFRAAFGIGLARDYGSSETGSLFSAEAGAPPGRVGHPLDGVDFRIVGDDGATAAHDDEPGELHVHIADAPDPGWRSTGDVAGYHPELGLRILGRQGRAVRRGDRWVAPEEVESVLRSHEDVLESRVTGVPGHTAGGPVTRLHAEVVSLRGTGADVADLHRHARDRLAPYKVPDRIRPVGELPRGRSGKLLPARRLMPGDEADLIACAQGHKRSELLFALLRLGVLDLLRHGPADSAHIAAELGLDAEVCEQLLQVAESAGLLRAAPSEPQDPPKAQDPSEIQEVVRGAAPADGLDGALAILALEERLSRSWVTREQLTGIARSGSAARDFDAEGPDDALREVYQRAMHTPAAYSRSRIGIRLSGTRAGRLLEITCGPGRYAYTHGPAGENRLLRVGTLAEQATHGADSGPRTGEGEGGQREVPPPDDGELFDLVVVCNAVHLPGPGSDLRALAARLAPGGRLLVDDVFLDAPGSLPQEIRLDWLTHGGSSWPTEATLTTGLAAAGFAVHRTVHVGRPAVTLVVAGLAGHPNPPFEGTV